MAERNRDPLLMVHERNSALLWRHRTIISICAAMALALVVSGALNLYLATHRPQPHYFAQNAQGGLTPIVSMDKPNESSGAILNFAAQSVLAVNTYDFANYRSQLSRAARGFTPNAWRRYVTQLKSTGTLSQVKKANLVVSSAISSAPVLQSDGVLYGTYYWNVQVPFVVRFQGNDVDKSYSMLALVKVVRVSPIQVSRGIAVAQFVAQTAPASS